MKKPFSNNDFSNKKCVSCGRPLKKNLLAKKSKADKCFRCFYPEEMARRGVRVDA